MRLTTRHVPLAVVPDLMEPVAILTAGLTAAERKQMESSGFCERRQRHFVLGRLAAHRAVQRLLGSSFTAVEVVTDPEGWPFVRWDGATPGVGVSISHSGRLAAACAWGAVPGCGAAAGVDVERLRPTQVWSTYAFTQRERRLIAEAAAGPSLAGLFAWTVKEAAWKAVCPNRDTVPAALEVRDLDLRAGRAVVALGRAVPARLRGVDVRVRTGLVHGPDGWYILSVARVSGS